MDVFSLTWFSVGLESCAYSTEKKEEEEEGKRGVEGRFLVGKVVRITLFYLSIHGLQLKSVRRDDVFSNCKTHLSLSFIHEYHILHLVLIWMVSEQSSCTDGSWISLLLVFSVAYAFFCEVLCCFIGLFVWLILLLNWILSLRGFLYSSVFSFSLLSSSLLFSSFILSSPLLSNISPLLHHTTPLTHTPTHSISSPRGVFS